MQDRFIAVGRGKAALLQHLRDYHGQLHPSSPAQWSLDELLAAHRVGHSEQGIVNVAHTHDAAERAA
jgi:hypothetical protein